MILSYDPIEIEQIEVLKQLLGEAWTEDALQGFRVVASRFVDAFGGHRTEELRHIFRTDRAEGRQALRRSLEHIFNLCGTFETFEASYTVSIIPAKPLFPLFKIVGIQTFVTHVYRVLHSHGRIYPSGESVRDAVMRTGRLGLAPRPRAQVRRAKSKRVHWCAYDRWDTPVQTQNALQILPAWSDCQLRATILAEHIQDCAYVAYNGDFAVSDSRKRSFEGYFFEPLAQDHPALTGGAPQIAVFGAPQVETLEEWDEQDQTWNVIWERA